MNNIRLLKPEEAPEPGTPDWFQTVTASKIPSMIGYDKATNTIMGRRTAEEVAAMLKGAYTPNFTEEELKKFKEGHAKETEAIEYFLANSMTCTKLGEQVVFTNDDLPFRNLATLDCLVESELFGSYELGIVECKHPTKITPKDLATWKHQVLAQMLISGIRKAWIVALHRDGEKKIIPVHWDPQKAESIIYAVQEFLQKHDITCPNPNYTPEDKTDNPNRPRHRPQRKTRPRRDGLDKPHHYVAFHPGGRNASRPERHHDGLIRIRNTTYSEAVMIANNLFGDDWKSIIPSIAIGRYDYPRGVLGEVVDGELKIFTEGK